MVATFVGISGSGKSRLAKQLVDGGYGIISPDLIRKELTGNTSDQSKNGLVFRMAHERLKEATKRGEDVVFDATNLRMSSLNDIAKIIGNTQELIIYMMMDSENPECCKARIEHDLKKGIDRAQTADDAILHRQYNSFMNMKSLLVNGFGDAALVRIGGTI